MKPIINKLYKHLMSKSIFRNEVEPDPYKNVNFKEPVYEEQKARVLISADEICRLREISNSYDHDLPKVLKESNLVRSDLDYCNESLALFMVLSQAYVGSYPQYATRYWSLFTNSSQGLDNVNISLVQAIHQAIGGQLVELLNSGVKQL